MVMLRIGAMQGVLRVHFEAGLACPGGTVGVVRRSRGWGWWRSGLIQLGWLMIVHVGLVGAVDGDWFVADSGEACTCIVDGGAGEGIGGA